ncbi:MAG: hypothetical protein NZ843_00240 [Fimbriimonadales bacterium]|nr:hypothetical protein [Fimbriimonadales bacterium]
MGNLEFRQIQLNLNAPVGPLNDVRRMRIMDAIGEGFNPQPVPIAGAIALVNPLSREAIFMNENQIQYTCDGMPAQFSPSRVETLLGAIRDTLLLEDRFPMILQVIAHQDANGSAFEKTVEAFTPIPPTTLRGYFPGLRGLGLRITFEDAPYICDLRIEPLFSDPAYFFIQFNAGSQQTAQSIAATVDDTMNWLNRLQGDIGDVIQEILGA